MVAAAASGGGGPSPVCQPRGMSLTAAGLRGILHPHTRHTFRAWTGPNPSVDWLRGMPRDAAAWGGTCTRAGTGGRVPSGGAHRTPNGHVRFRYQCPLGAGVIAVVPPLAGLPASALWVALAPLPQAMRLDALVAVLFDMGIDCSNRSLLAQLVEVPHSPARSRHLSIWGGPCRLVPPISHPTLSKSVWGLSKTVRGRSSGYCVYTPSATAPAL